MPPLIEDGASSEDEIPFVEESKVNNEDEIEEEAEEEGSGADDPDEYIVDKILNHAWDDVDGILKFEVKWQGYEKIEDRTWEPEENLETAQDVLKQYFKKIGGRPTKPTASNTKKSKKRNLDDVDTPKNARGSKKGKHEDTPEVANGKNKRASKAEQKWTPPAGSWENEVVDVDTIEEVLDAADGIMKRHAYVVWNNGNKTRHLLKVLNLKCPQKMLQYYESHLVFRPTESDTNGAKKEA